MKKIPYLAFFLLFSVAAWAQQAVTPKEFTVTGKVKNGSAGEKVYLQFSTNPPTTLDSATLAADGTFTIKGMEKEGGNFYMLDLAGRQKIILLVEGGENFTVTADGFEQNSKGEPGTYEVKGSKNMDYYPKLMDLNQAMVSKVNKWNDEYAKATDKKDEKKMQEIQAAGIQLRRDQRHVIGRIFGDGKPRPRGNEQRHGARLSKLQRRRRVSYD